MGGRRIRGSRLAAAAATALLAAGCGGSSDDERPPGRDLTALQCPLVRAGDVEGVPQYEPAEDAFDTKRLIGMRLERARATAAGHGCEIVVASEDGRGRPVPIDVDPKRIYVFVEDDAVTYIEGVGGGI